MGLFFTATLKALVISASVDAFYYYTEVEVLQKITSWVTHGRCMNQPSEN
jgi:hypothetical protein